MPEHTFKKELGASKMTTARSATVGYTSTTIAAGGTIGVYTTTPVQFTASTPYDVSRIRVWNIASNANSGARGDTAIKIMGGAGGSEYPIIEALLFGGRPAYSSYTLPIYIAAGTRISGVVAAGVASRSLTWNIDLWQKVDDDRGPARWIAYGTNISSGVGAYGTLITPGNATFSSWTALTTNTTYAHDLWMPMTAVGTGTAITAQNCRSQFAIDTTANAATMVTNSTGIFEGSWHTGTTAELWGQYNVGANPVHMGLQDIIFAPRRAGGAASARTMASTAPDSNIASCAILAAVK